MKLPAIPFEAAVVAHVAAAVGSDGGAVGATPQLGNHLDLAGRGDSGERAAANLDQHDTSVGHGDRALGKQQSAGEFFEVGHLGASSNLA